MYLLLRADQRLKHNHEDVLLLAHLQELFPSEKELGLIMSQIIIRLSLTQCQNNWALFFVMVIDFEKMMEWQFWRIKDHLQNEFVHSRHWSHEKWKSTVAKGGGNKKRFQNCTDPSGQEILDLRALQGHSRRNFIDLALQDNVSIPNNFFEYIYHIGCAINLHSIMNSGLIPGGQNLSKRQTVYFTSVDPMNKEHKDPNHIDLEAPRLGMYKQKVENTS